MFYGILHYGTHGYRNSNFGIIKNNKSKNSSILIKKMEQNKLDTILKNNKKKFNKFIHVS